MPTNLHEELRQEIEASRSASDYNAFDTLWVILVRVCNSLPGSSEHRRMTALVDKIPVEKLIAILRLPAVENLLNLDPPLETVLTNANERLDLESTRKNIEIVLTTRDTHPIKAMYAMGEILKRIRNKRAHGFKSPKGPRDQQILRAARTIVETLCLAAIDVI